MKAQAFVEADQRRAKRGTAAPTGRHRRILKAERERAKLANRINLPWEDA
jgi:molybdenum-dependent DNA-binding transcriptional regulator ModE